MKLRKGGSRESQKAEIFISFNENTILNGFFNFELLKRIQIVGLGDFLKKTRGVMTLKDFAKKFGISHGFLSQIEREQSALPIEFLIKILSTRNEPLMPFLLLNKNKILFRKMNSPPIKLDLKPNKKLFYYGTKMTFFKTTIGLPKKDQYLQTQIQNHFIIKIQNNSISNKLIQYYFKTFGKFKLLN